MRMFVRMYVCVCLLLSHAKTTERIGMKFGIKVDYSLTHRILFILVIGSRGVTFELYTGEAAGRN